MEILRLLGSIVDAGFSFVGREFLARLVSEDAFFWGWIWGMATLVVLGGFTQLISHLWDSVLRFFRITREPTPSWRPGPKPVETTVGCGRGAVGLLLIGGSLLLLALRLLGII
jgi:hypothetical protein